MIWLDYFLQLFAHALAWCLAVAVTVALSAAAFRLGVWLLGLLDRPRALRAERSPWTGGLS